MSIFTVFLLFRFRFLRDSKILGQFYAKMFLHSKRHENSGTGGGANISWETDIFLQSDIKMWK